MISQQKKNNMRICAQLIRRNLHVLAPRMPSKLIDSTIIAITQVLVFGCFFPVLGMPAKLIGPTFIGTIILMCFSLGYGLVLPFVFDLEQDRFIDYHLTLPIGKFWLFTAYVTNFVMEITLTTLPVFFLSILLLGKNFIQVETTLLGFFVSYFLSLTFLALLLIAFSLRYSMRWFFDNLWPRRLAPLTLLGSIFFVWGDVYALSPLLGRLFLLNPCTYVTESIRASLIGGTEFIPLKICLTALIISIVASSLLLKNSIMNRLDPV